MADATKAASVPVVDWTLRMSALAAEWHGIQERTRTADVAVWRAELATMSAAMEARVRTGTWRVGPCDMFSVLNRQRDELSHSRFLGWLLDPLGHHGLGDRLVHTLLSEVCAADQMPSASWGVRVELEVSRSESRADIIVAVGDHTVVIENKVDALEGPAQCSRLARDHPEAILIFLSPSGRQPTSAGDSTERWYPLSWRRLRTLIEVLLRDSPPSTRGSHLVQDYLATLRGAF